MQMENENRLEINFFSKAQNEPSLESKPQCLKARVLRSLNETGLSQVRITNSGEIGTVDLV